MGAHAAAGSTRVLLICSALAGPIYLAVVLLQLAIRAGFDIGKHALGLLSNGPLGWIQIANFIVAGSLVLVGAVGIRRATRPGRASTWGPVWLFLYGLGLIGAGIFVADPAQGFPPDTAEPTAASLPGILHFICGAIGIAAFVTACLVFSRRFIGLRQYSWAMFSLVTGIYLLAAYIGVVSGSHRPLIMLSFDAADLLGWAWLTALSLYLMTHQLLTEGNVGGFRGLTGVAAAKS
jgi:hypothetical protein